MGGLGFEKNTDETKIPVSRQAGSYLIDAAKVLQMCDAAILKHFFCVSFSLAHRTT